MIHPDSVKAWEAETAALRAEIARLQQENADLRRWKALDKPITAAMNVVNNDVQSLRAEIARLQDRIDEHHRIFEPMRAEIERLQSCLYAQESVPQLYAEIKRLRSVCDAAFYEMCAYRDNSDREVFQDAIDALGSALKDTPPRHEPKTKAPGG